MIDLRMHTIYSDGSDNSIDLLKKCEESKLEIISITDHDTIDAWYWYGNLNIDKKIILNWYNL